MRMIKLCSVHSIHSQWKSKQMLATYMWHMRNKNLKIARKNSNNIYYCFCKILSFACTKCLLTTAPY